MYDYKLGKTRSVIIMISPLLSLMVDQVCSLRSRGVSAAILSGNSGIDKQYIATDWML